MPNLSSGKKVTLKNLEDNLRTSAGVPIPKMANLKGITKTALAKVYELHLANKVKFKVDTQGRLKAYAKDYVPKVGRPRNPENEVEVEAETAEAAA